MHSAKKAFKDAFLRQVGLSESNVNIGRLSYACIILKSCRLVFIHCGNDLEFFINRAFMTDSAFKQLEEMLVNIYNLLHKSAQNKQFIKQIDCLLPMFPL